MVLIIKHLGSLRAGIEAFVVLKHNSQDIVVFTTSTFGVITEVLFLFFHPLLLSLLLSLLHSFPLCQRVTRHKVWIDI